MTIPGDPRYRYIARVPGVSGGRPITEGTRTPIKSIVGYYEMGLSLEEILEGLPFLIPAQVFESPSYYHDHQSEIEADIRASQVERLIERYGLKVTADGRIVAEESRGA